MGLLDFLVPASLRQATESQAGYQPPVQTSLLDTGLMQAIMDKTSWMKYQNLPDPVNVLAPQSMRDLVNPPPPQMNLPEQINPGQVGMLPPGVQTQSAPANTQKSVSIPSTKKGVSEQPQEEFKYSGMGILPALLAALGAAGNVAGTLTNKGAAGQGLISMAGSLMEQDDKQQARAYEQFKGQKKAKALAEMTAKEKNPEMRALAQGFTQAGDYDAAASTLKSAATTRQYQKSALEKEQRDLESRVKIKTWERMQPSKVQQALLNSADLMNPEVTALALSGAVPDKEAKAKARSIPNQLKKLIEMSPKAMEKVGNTSKLSGSFWTDKSLGIKRIRDSASGKMGYMIYDTSTNQMIDLIED